MYSKTKIYLKKFFGSGWSHHVKNTEIIQNIMISEEFMRMRIRYFLYYFT